nr:XRE family transcriptional regulator [uncultured Bacteroides sp.]
MNTNLKDRFKELLLKLEIGQGKFEELCGMGNGTINNIKIGISSPNLEKISNTFPEINLIWLITGKGEMFIENQTVITDSPTSNKDIKILDIRVCAGHGIGFDGDENKVIGYVNIPEFTGCYGITVYGDSMYDMYMSGDTIFVREIKDKTLIDNGQPYVVITQEDRLLKMVYIESGGLKLVSFNPICNPDGRRKYPDMEIEGSRILHLYKVVGKLARTQM